MVMNNSMNNIQHLLLRDSAIPIDEHCYMDRFFPFIRNTCIGCMFTVMGIAWVLCDSTLAN